MDCKIMHIDMDAFFAAVEQRDNPHYRNKPVIVGADPRGRGVVSTCSYEARKFGIRSAMPIKEAYQRCPQGIFIPPRGERYARVSREIMNILEEYTSLVEPLSLDEAFLDLTGSEALFGPAVEIARQIVARIENEIGLSASVGLAPNKFLAKLASDLQKPKGFVIITHENALLILENLPVSKIWGVGPKTEAQLLEMGIKTIGMLRRMAPDILSARFGEAGEHLYNLANGIDDRPVATGEETKSVGHELTFQTDVEEREFLKGVLLWLTDQVARRLRRYGMKGRTITVKMRDHNFKTITRRTTLSEATDFEETIYREALSLAEQVQWGSRKVRLIGVSVSGFGPDAPVQLDLFGAAAPEPEHDLEKLHQTVDMLRDRFGDEIITKGTVLQIKRKFWHKD
jgi:nucleotidyltransferase/DNA polymerase involved in DNA repair